MKSYYYDFLNVKSIGFKQQINYSLASLHFYLILRIIPHLFTRDEKKSPLYVF